jgi:hypothetical protein
MAAPQCEHWHPSLGETLASTTNFRHTGEMNDDKSARVAALLHEAGETHHTVYRIVDGDDPDWATWYGDWLTNLSELPQVLGTAPVRSELVWLLVSLDREYADAESDTPWPQWYADRIVKHFTPAAE